MSNVKLSQIAAGSPVNFNTDFLVGVQASNTTDARITPIQLFTSFPSVNTSTTGVVPVSPGGTTTFLRADGAWATPAGGGGGAGSAASLHYVIDGGGLALTTGVKGYLICDFGGTINSATLLADISGSITIDIWKCTYAQFDAGATHPVVGDSITASATPALASATKYQDLVLTGWNTTVNAGDVFAFNVKVAAVNCTRVTVDLKVIRS
jgi:hypothetical protein